MSASVTRPLSLVAIVFLARSLLASGAAAQSPPESPEWEPDRRLTRARAASQTSINFARSLAADEAGRVHLVWRAEQDGSSEIYYKRSLDGGVSWGPAIRLTRAPGRSENPSIAVSGDTVAVVWWDERTGVHQIWHKRSDDGGISWQADAQVTHSPGGGAHCSLAVSGTTWHVVYVDGRDGSTEVYYVRSRDAGTSWQAPVRLSALPNNSYTPTVAVWRSSVYVAWTDTRHFGRVDSLEEEYFRRSTDGGATFEPEQRLTSDPAGHPANSWAPSLSAREHDVFIAWFDDRDGNFEIYARRSSDSGVSWSPAARLTASPGQSQRPVLSQRDEQLFVVYWDDSESEDQVYLLQSNDLGESWSAPERLSSGGAASLLPGVAAAATGVHVAWTDGRDQNPEVYYKRLGGEPVTVGNGRIAFSRFVNGESQIFTAAADGSDETQLTFAYQNTYPAWSKDGARLAFSSNRSGAFEIWSMNPDGSGVEQVTRGAPSGSFVPEWSWDGTRIAYAYLDDGVGHPEVWVMNADGTDPARRTMTPPGSRFTWSLNPTWEPGDARIYYASTAGGTSQIWGMFADGRGQEQKTSGVGPGAPHANAPEFGRDGRLTFWAGFEGQYGEVWIWDTPGVGFPTPATATPDPANSDNPSWAPDGAVLLFDSNRADPRGSINVWVTTSDGFDPGLLIPGATGPTSWQPTHGLPRAVRQPPVVPGLRYRPGPHAVPRGHEP